MRASWCDRVGSHQVLQRAQLLAISEASLSVNGDALNESSVGAGPGLSISGLCSIAAGHCSTTGIDWQATSSPLDASNSALDRHFDFLDAINIDGLHFR